MVERNDHDLLTEIATKLNLFMEMFHKHAQDDSAVMAILTRDIKAAHKRMDFLSVSGILAIIFFAITLWVKTK